MNRLLRSFGSRITCITTHVALLLALWAGTAFAEADEEFRLLYFGQKEGRIAFSYELDNQDDVYVLDFFTFSVYPLVEHPSDDHHPSWSPDGRWLAFASDRSGQSQIYLQGEEGSAPIQLTNLDGDSESPDWSPDGAYLVFQSTFNSLGKSIYVMNADGSNPRRIVSTTKSTTVPHWSPRGIEILYSTNEYWPGWDLALFDINSRSSKVLTKGVNGFCRGSWHPTGSIIALSYGAGKEVDIWLLEKGRDRIVPLIQMPGREYDAEWIDEGNKLVFSGEDPPGSGKYQLFLWDRGSKKVHQLTKSRGSIRHPSWTALPSLNSIRQRVALEKRTNK